MRAVGYGITAYLISWLVMPLLFWIIDMQHSISSGMFLGLMSGIVDQTSGGMS